MRRLAILVALDGGTEESFTASFKVAAGKSAKVKVKLSKAACRHLARKHRLNARVRADASDAGGHRKTTTGTVTLKRG